MLSFTRGRVHLENQKEAKGHELQEASKHTAPGTSSVPQPHSTSLARVRALLPLPCLQGLHSCFQQMLLFPVAWKRAANGLPGGKRRGDQRLNSDLSAEQVPVLWSLHHPPAPACQGQFRAWCLGNSPRGATGGLRVPTCISVSQTASLWTCTRALRSTTGRTESSSWWQTR